MEHVYCMHIQCKCWETFYTNSSKCCFVVECHNFTCKAIFKLLIYCLKVNVNCVMFRKTDVAAGVSFNYAVNLQQTRAGRPTSSKETSPLWMCLYSGRNWLVWQLPVEWTSWNTWLEYFCWTYPVVSFNLQLNWSVQMILKRFISKFSM